MEIPDRRLDRNAGPSSDVAALVLVGVAVSDKSEHPCGIIDAATPAATEVGAHGTRFDIHVVSGRSIAGRRLHHLVDVVDAESARYNLLVSWIEPA